MDLIYTEVKFLYLCGIIYVLKAMITETTFNVAFYSCEWFALVSILALIEKKKRIANDASVSGISLRDDVANLTI